jgi:dienelactone hydrolase
MNTDPPTPADLTVWPRPTGPHTIGCARFEVCDPERVETFAPSPALGRRITGSAWFPAKPGSGGAPRPYLTEAEARTLPIAISRLMGLPDTVWMDFTRLETCGRPDAEIIDAAPGSLPLLVFSHGALSYETQNTALMEELASHGYVVLSLGHPHESGGVVTVAGEEIAIAPRLLDDFGRVMRQRDSIAAFGTGSLVERLERTRRKSALMRTSWLSRMGQAWAQDAMFLVDCIAGAAAMTGAWAHTVDTSRVGYFGMSYGGHVAARLCALDERAVAGINIDGGMWTWDTVNRDLPVPFLSLHCDPAVQFVPAMKALGLPVDDSMRYLTPATPLHCDLDFERLATAGEARRVFRLALPGLAHLAFTDFPVLLKGAHAAAMGSGPLVGPRGMAAQNHACRAFFDRFVRGDTAAFPQPVLDEFPAFVTRDMRGLAAEARALEAASPLRSS